MMDGSDFHERDQKAACGFSGEAHRAGLRRIIYLGGLGDPDAELSAHLRSRQDTGAYLRESGVPVTECRAGIVVGAGSISFEMIRYLTERVPIMIAPRWVYTRTQPISIRNVLDYLVAGLQLNASESQIFEIGGPEVMSYGDMLLGYAQVRGLRRWIVPVPVLTPRLSSYWVHWVTPIPATIARPLIEGLRSEVIVRTDNAHQRFGQIELIPYPTAVSDALSNLEARQVETAWSDALVTTQGDEAPVQLTTQEGMIIEQRRMEIEPSPEKTFHAFTTLGGETGWLYANWAWWLRGWIDRLVGGVGFRRGRRDPVALRVGDAVDFWRVERLIEYEQILLRAEMKLPGKAWLQFEAQPKDDGGALLTQTAYFAPKGLFGLLYWYGLYPIHAWIFSGLIREVAKMAADIEAPPP
ncbi:MAG: SDR family oxidoreductase [Anaerolineales bacterium]|nr:SDR family oxidoreductase [Anaerolineales bacterium]